MSPIVCIFSAMSVFHLCARCHAKRTREGFSLWLTAYGVEKRQSDLRLQAGLVFRGFLWMLLTEERGRGTGSISDLGGQTFYIREACWPRWNCARWCHQQSRACGSVRLGLISCTCSMLFPYSFFCLTPPWIEGILLECELLCNQRSNFDVRAQEEQESHRKLCEETWTKEETLHFPTVMEGNMLFLVSPF